MIAGQGDGGHPSGAGERPADADLGAAAGHEGQHGGQPAARGPAAVGGRQQAVCRDTRLHPAKYVDLSAVCYRVQS